MTRRFYLDPSVSSLHDDAVTLRGDEAHHFNRVLRGKVGDEIYLFDGTGPCYRCVVQAVRKDAVEAAVMQMLLDEIESPLRLTVATALPKGERQGFLVEKLAELGVDRLVPLHLDRSVARVGDGTLDRLKRRVVEAAKQCGRNVLMEITPEMSLDACAGLLEDDTKYLLHPVSLGRVGQTTPRRLLNEPLPNRVAVLVGPEGSFTEQEVEKALEHGFQPLELGARILRTETACMAAAALLLTYAG